MPILKNLHMDKWLGSVLADTRQISVYQYKTNVSLPKHSVVADSHKVLQALTSRDGTNSTFICMS